MPLHQLYNLVTGTMNPSYLTGLTPGGAGVQTSAVVTNPGISAPRLEESTIEVLDVTAPTLLSAVANAVTYPTPAAVGKVIQIAPFNGIGGSRWKQNAVLSQPIARGQYGVVVSAANTQNAASNDAGPAVGTAGGNEALYGSKAVVMYDGPTYAFVETQVGGIAISQGMPLVADGAGNLTAFSYGNVIGTGAKGVPVGPSAGTVLATALGSVAASTSIPVLIPVYVGGY